MNIVQSGGTLDLTGSVIGSHRSGVPLGQDCAGYSKVALLQVDCLDMTEFEMVDCILGQMVFVRSWAGSPAVYIGRSEVAEAESLIDSSRLVGPAPQKKQRFWLASVGLETCCNGRQEDEMSNPLSYRKILK
jgi:hypothetical protein